MTRDTTSRDRWRILSVVKDIACKNFGSLGGQESHTAGVVVDSRSYHVRSEAQVGRIARQGSAVVLGCRA
jgi:hypothetical protein